MFKNSNFFKDSLYPVWSHSTQSSKQPSRGFRCVVVLPSTSGVPIGSREPTQNFFWMGLGFFKVVFVPCILDCPKHQHLKKQEEVAKTVCAFLESTFAKCPQVPCKSTFPQQMAYLFQLLVANYTMRIHLHSSLMEVFTSWKYI